MLFKFYDDPTVKESEIIVLVGQVWVYVEKDKAQCKEHFFYHGHYLENPGKTPRALKFINQFTSEH